MEKIIIGCIIGILLCVPHTFTMEKKLRDSQEYTMIGTLCSAVAGPVTGALQVVQRSYKSRFDPETMRKMLGLEPDDEELNKTRIGYQAVCQKFGACSDEELDFFVKRSALALKCGNKLCKGEDYDSRTKQEIDIMLREHGPYLPPFATEKLKEMSREITVSLKKDLLSPDVTSIEELSSQRQQEILDSFLKSEHIDSAAYYEELEACVKMACEKATHDTTFSLNTKYLTDYFKEKPQN